MSSFMVTEIDKMTNSMEVKINALVSRRNVSIISRKANFVFVIKQIKTAPVLQKYKQGQVSLSLLGIVKIAQFDINCLLKKICENFKGDQFS